MALGAILVLSIGVAAACSSDGDSALEDRLGALEQQVAALDTGIRQSAMLEQQVAALDTGIQQSAMIGTLGVLRDVGLHSLDEIAVAGGEVPAGVSGSVDRARLAVAATRWPEELSAQAGGLDTKLEALSVALDGDDSAAVAAAIREAHDAWHAFDIDCSEHLAETVGLGEPQDASEHDMESPTGGSTPGHMDAGG